ncbi:MAG: Lrp/AsnC family transcriptional regulator [Pseudomonadota bacterium]
MELSKNDRQILSVLTENARTPVAEIARQVGLSRSTVVQRIERLERSGAITGYTLRISNDIQRGLLRALVMISVIPKSTAGVVRSLRALKPVRELYAVNGVFDLSAIVVAQSTEELDHALDRLGNIEGVEKTVSSIVLSTKFAR